MPDRLRILITAGPTREYLDPVRYISNDSSGQMGFALARAAQRRGHRVTLVHGPVALRPPRTIRSIGVLSAADMLAACVAEWDAQDVLVMAAAVADYAPARVAAHKLKKDAATRTLRLRKTVDILAKLAQRRRPEQVVIGFALESRQGRQNAEQKLQRKKLDAVVLNTPRAIGAAQSSAELLVKGQGWETVSIRSKARIATHIVKLAEALVQNRSQRRADRLESRSHRNSRSHRKAGSTGVLTG